jgi:hypothetical protein
MNGAEESWREKRPAETNLEWRARVEHEEQLRLRHSGPLVTPEAEQHAEYKDEFVLHIESFTLARTKRNMATSPFADLFFRGVIDKDQYGASVEIVSASEILTRDTGMRGASFEARVDGSGSARDALVEHIAQVRLSVAYTEWRKRLPMPKRMILDMLLEPGSLFVKARRFRVGWPKARRQLIQALDNWIEIREKVARNIDEKDVEWAHIRALDENQHKGACA